MITSAQIFSVANLIAMLCWVALAISLFASRIRVWTLRVTGLIVPGIFAVVYLFCIWKGFAATPGGGFGSLSEVRALFANDAALDAGWLHYLAFDLFVGTWIVRQGALDGMHPLWLLLCLPVTFMLGPVGFLLFLIARSVFSRPSAARIAA
jgi:ABA4-like protein